MPLIQPMSPPPIGQLPTQLLHRLPPSRHKNPSPPHEIQFPHKLAAPFPHALRPLNVESADVALRFSTLPTPSPLLHSIHAHPDFLQGQPPSDDVGEGLIF